jgi:hypothetical protein
MNLLRPAASFGELITLDYCNGWTTFKSRVFAVGLRANFGWMLELVIGNTLDYGFGETSRQIGIDRYQNFHQGLRKVGLGKLRRSSAIFSSSSSVPLSAKIL